MTIDTSAEAVERVLALATQGKPVQFNPQFCEEAKGAKAHDWDTSHDLSVIRADGSRYKIGHFRHADDALFDQLARELVPALSRDLEAMRAERDAQQSAKDGAYLERNRLVALLAAIFPAGIKRTKIEGWSPDWHGCVYIDFPWGQASWHYHDSHAHLFSHLPPYPKDWDGHTTEGKYEAIGEAAVRYPISAVDGYAQHIRNERDAAIARAEQAETRVAELEAERAEIGKASVALLDELVAYLSQNAPAHKEALAGLKTARATLSQEVGE